jgi:hypothetical protein
MRANSASAGRTLPVTPAQSAERELRLQTVLIAYVLAGLFFMLLPRTFLGVWNLVSISSRRAPESLSPSWLQAHGQAQIFGWIGTFIIGIGFYSLSKMGRLAPFAVSRAWICFVLWTAGASLRWLAGVVEWHWRFLLPLSALLQLSGFLIFFFTVSGHRANSGEPSRHRPEPWMLLVIASTFGLLFSLLLNCGADFWAAGQGVTPALPHSFDQRLVALEAWGFLVPAIWGFNARWLPVFVGLRAASGKFLLTALALVWTSILADLGGLLIASALVLPVAAITAIQALHVWQPAIHPAKTNGIHPSFRFFIRTAYVWLLVASSLWALAAWVDHSGGIWGAARHALTVGFITTMVFAIGQRVLPAFGGGRVLYSPRLMFFSLVTLNIGCALRVGSEIPAYEGYSVIAWRLLPCSAVIELLAVALFAANLLATFVRPPAHLAAS